MRKIIIDTDTASDDAVAIIMALRAKNIHVEAITTVAGNVPIDVATRNALISIEMANTYAPPVYVGSDKPLKRDLFTSTSFHGSDGMGDMDLPIPKNVPMKESAIDKMIELIDKFPYQIELIAIGPLTNIALAIQKAPNTMRKLKKLFIMGGNGLGPGNITDYAEFNFYADAEAAQIVLEENLNPFILGWDVSLNDSYVNESDIDFMTNCSMISSFCVRSNQSIIEFNQREFNKTGFVLPDPALLAVAIDDKLIEDSIETYSAIVTNGERYGQLIVDFDKTPNSTLCKKMSTIKFKEMLFNLTK
ncbi:nucleoside hydrolase [Mycoplasmatota bacterium zrk1]